MVHLSDDPRLDKMATDWLRVHRHGVDTSEAYADLRDLLAEAKRLGQTSPDGDDPPTGELGCEDEEPVESGRRYSNVFIASTARRFGMVTHSPHTGVSEKSSTRAR
jgi:hypothetical protein